MTAATQDLMLKLDVEGCRYDIKPNQLRKRQQLAFFVHLVECVGENLLLSPLGWAEILLIEIIFFCIEEISTDHFVMSDNRFGTCSAI